MIGPDMPGPDNLESSIHYHDLQECNAEIWVAQQTSPTHGTPKQHHAWHSTQLITASFGPL
jgi:hypothetical protein